MKLGCIVEGYGELEAVPMLVRRIAEQKEVFSVDIKAFRKSRNKLLQEGGLERAVLLAAEFAGVGGGVLVVIDAEEEDFCPAKRGPELLERAKSAASHIPVSLVIANRKFESWFLAVADSLAGRHGLSAPLDPPGNSESLKSAKTWLTDRMPLGRKYRETIHQAKFTMAMNIDLAEQRSRSFAKCKREIERLLKELTEDAP